MRTLVFVLALLPIVFAGQIDFSLDQFGLAKVFYNDQVVLNVSKSFFCFGYTLTHPNGTSQFIYQDQSTLNSPNKTLDADGYGFSLMYTNWKYYCKYSVPQQDEFLITCDVTNLHPTAAIRSWNFALMRNMKMPLNVTINNSGQTGLDDASLSFITSSTGDFAIAAFGTSAHVPTVVQTVTNYEYHSISAYWKAQKPEDFIPVGGTVTLGFKLKFGPLNSTYQVLGQEAFEIFREQYPMTLNWPDRRPILTHFSASPNHASDTNPRGFFGDGLDFVSEEGKADFKTRLLASANTVVDNMKKVNAQGMVLWDMEGNELPHAITYIGDPVHAELMAPELVGAIDDYFKIITDAGFKCGMTIRPQQMEFGPDVPVGPCVNNSIYIHYNGDFHKKGYTCINDVYYISLPYFQPPGGDPTEIMITKMKYAKERWGCTIFYVDSNAPPGAWAYTSEVHEAVTDAVPGILVLPEQELPRYFRSMAPYGEIDMNVWYVNVQSTVTYPEAFAAINVQDGTLYDDLLTESTLRGNVFLARGWFADKRTSELYAKLQNVSRDYPYSIDGVTKVQGKVGEKISVGVTLTAERKSGITFDWKAQGGIIQQTYSQYLSTVEIVYNQPGTYTVDLIVRRGIDAKTHSVTVDVVIDTNSPSGRMSGSSLLNAFSLLSVISLALL